MQKVLLITYYWPPAGGAGVQRWLKMSKYLAEECELYVYSPKNAHYITKDKSLVKEVSPKITQLQSEIWEPYALANKLNKKNKQYQKGMIEDRERQSLLSKLSLWVRANFFIPDARLFWIKSGIKYLDQQLNLEEFDVLISTGPPHSTHLIALGLKEKYPKLKWLSDFRDPWTKIDYFDKLPLSKGAMEKHRTLEKKVLKKSDVVTTVSPSWAKDLEWISKRKVEVVYNGYDVDDFADIQKHTPENIVLTYMGSLNQDRNPTMLWEVLNEKCREEAFKNNFELRLVGHIAQEVIEEVQSFPWLKDCLKIYPYLSHQQALEELQKASVLLLLINNVANQKGIIPGKFFEYMASEKPILCIGNKKSDMASILEQIQTGVVVNFKDKKDLSRKINYFYQLYLKNKLALSNVNDIEVFSRENAAKKIARLIQF